MRMTAASVISRDRINPPAMMPAGPGALTFAGALSATLLFLRVLSGRCKHDPLLGRFGSRDLGRNPTLVEHHDSIAHGEDLGQFAGDQDDPQTGGREVRDDAMDPPFRAMSTPRGGPSGEEPSGLGGPPFPS